MKYILLFLISVNVFANELTFESQQDGSVVIKVPKEIVEQCKKEGGCVLISYQSIEEVVRNSARYLCGKES